MGYPVAHSRSPVIHRLFAQQTGQELQYELLRVAPEKLEEAVRQFQRTGGKGLNITVPHKRAVFRLVDHLSERASTAGAVNTLSFRNNEIYGDNTDGIGLLRDLVVNLGLQLEGGIANRTLKRAEDLVERFASRGPISACSFDAVPVSGPYDLVINATSAIHGREMPPYPEEAISPQTFCYDLSYSLHPTPFCQWALEHGAAHVVMGWGMLVEQAAESFHIWRGVRPDTKPVLKQISISA
jgi:shikimate dehydrogenase